MSLRFYTTLATSRRLNKSTTARLITDRAPLIYRPLVLFGSENALTRVIREEYAHSHELGKLLGFPPGCVGHDIEPLLSQRRIERHHRGALAEREGMVGRGNGRIEEVLPAYKKNYLSVVLFDEIKKSHPVPWNALLGILRLCRY